CKPHCPCQCHIPLQGSTPRWLRGLMGSLFFNFTGTPLLNHRSCNFSVCGAKDASSGSAYFQYYFPKWLLTKGVMIRGHWEDLGGIGATWTFRIPKAVTSSILNGELLSVGRYRPVMEVKQFMALNHIAAVDIDMTGESVFEVRAIDTILDLITKIPPACAHRENMFGTLQSLPEFEEELEIMNFNALHRIVLGLSAHNLRSQIELDPALVHARDCFGFTPLHWAAQRDDLDAINILLDAGADINAHCSQGRTPLSWAVWCGSFHCCKTLMDPSAHVKTAKPSGSNAIAGLRRGPVKTDTISLLLKRGADINMKDSNRGRTCLMESTVLGTASICETLLDHGADMELHNMSGSSAAFHAIYTNNPDVLKVLIRRGACLTFRDKLGRSIIDYTALYGGIEVM
ncbi:ankyrin, partial [Amniculicola lignicola CBS 123094]